jgi:DNA invertase Pin-like site-specific DNA recombinase
MKAALYLRVSTSKDDLKQTTENQLIALQSYCASHGWVIGQTYEDYESGAKGMPGRPRFAAMLDAAKRKEFDVVLFWSLDRLTREGVRQTLIYLQMLDDAGVAFVSHQEQFLDTCGMFRDAVISILATLAKQELIRISERVKASNVRRLARGDKLGRKPLPVDEDKLAIARQDGLSLREMAGLLGVSKTTVDRRLRSQEGRA